MSSKQMQPLTQVCSFFVFQAHTSGALGQGVRMTMLAQGALLMLSAASGGCMVEPTELLPSLRGHRLKAWLLLFVCSGAGNSGGPLLDSGGCLIGINTAIYSPSGANSGVGFAIPVDVVKSSVEQIIEHGRVTRPILGISFAPDQSSEQLGVKGE
jgi:hypothetical protein